MCPMVWIWDPARHDQLCGAFVKEDDPHADEGGERLMLSFKVIEYIAMEVWRQGDGPLHVAHMCRAWEYAIRQHRRGEPLTHRLVQEFGRMIEPDENHRGAYRTHQVRVGGRLGTEPLALHAEMTEWLKGCHDIDPDEAYRRFEMIHPFADGNGRTGKVLLNWLKGTLRDPKMPPNFFNVSKSLDAA